MAKSKKPIKIYVAGRMSKHSGYSDHTWRDEFLKKISQLSGLKFISFDPTRAEKDYTDLEMVFASDVHMIKSVDVLLAYLSDDVSVGGSQEILIAKYFSKPVIGFAPYGGKFNVSAREIAGVVIKDYKHPFVYTTCDVVCGTIEEVAQALQNMGDIKPKTLNIIDKAYKRFSAKHSKTKMYEEHLIE